MMRCPLPLQEILPKSYLNFFFCFPQDSLYIFPEQDQFQFWQISIFVYNQNFSSYFSSTVHAFKVPGPLSRLKGLKDHENIFRLKPWEAKFAVYSRLMDQLSSIFLTTPESKMLG